jgi:hypothetical protein
MLPGFADILPEPCDCVKMAHLLQKSQEKIMTMRISVSAAAMSAMVLLAACEAPTGASTATAAAGSGAENCLEAIKQRAATQSLLGSTVSVSPDGITTVGAQTAGAQSWTCIAGADGRVESVMNMKPNNR